MDFPFCKKLVATLFKVVGKERRAIATERSTYVKGDALQTP
jgi:hypothetical protein